MDPALTAQNFVLKCEDCEETSVCTCRICDVALCREHFGNHMDTNHELCKTKNNSICTKHSLLFKHYCRSCIKPICSDCVRYEDHSNHGLSDPAAMLDFYKEIIAIENEELRNVIKPFYSTILEVIEERRSELDINISKARENVKEFGRKLHEQVDIAVMHYYETLAANEKEQLEKIQFDLNVFQQRIEEIEKKLEDNAKLLQRNDPFDLMTLFKSSLADFPIYPELYEFNIPVFQPNVPDFKTLLHIAGEISYIPRTENPLSLKCKHFQLSRSQLLEHPLHKSSSSNLNILDLSCLQSDGVLTVGKNNQFKQLQFKWGKFYHVQTNEIECRSQYVAISPNDAIYFSDTVNRSIKKYGNVYCHLLIDVLDFDDLEPRGLTFTPSGHLLVCLYSKQRSFVARYINDNKLVQDIEHNGDKPLYKEPCFVCCNRNGDVCVTDHGLNAVIVVDMFGVFQFSYRGQNEKSFRPYCLATDHLCNIVITDNVNHEIHLLDKYGQFLGFLTTEPRIIRPGALDIDRNGKLWMEHSTRGELTVVRYLR